MPTDNRSSNTEMVSVPRKLLETIRSFHWTQQDSADLARAKARADLIDMLTKRTEQHRISIEARKCDGCNHVGINDTHDSLAACHECGWSGPGPVEDKCPRCKRENVMAAACPDCGSRYELVDSKDIVLPAEQHQCEPVGEVVAFGEGLHEIAWSQGKMPRLGARLYTNLDPGEAERLRTVVDQQQSLIASLRAELVECRGIDASTAPTTPAVSIPDGYCLMPRRLTAENGAKALLLGEFKLQVTRECPECLDLEEPAEGCEICDGEGEYAQHHMIPWDQIKFIYSEAVKGLAIQPHAVLELRSVGANDGQA